MYNYVSCKLQHVFYKLHFLHVITTTVIAVLVPVVVVVDVVVVITVINVKNGVYIRRLQAVSSYIHTTDCQCTDCVLATTSCRSHGCSTCC